jgi:vancomycin permeability regulator SanA
VAAEPVAAPNPWRWRVLAGLALLVVLATGPSAAERALAAAHLRSAAAVPRTPVAVVFGAKVYGRRPTAFLVQRLDGAVGLYRRGQVAEVLVSGRDDHHGYDEPGVMRTYLIAHGVPASRIVVDDGGDDTWSTCSRAAQVFGVRQAVLVTQAFHVARAVELCRANGVTGYGLGLGSLTVGWQSTVYGYFREFFAADKAGWDVLTR